MRFLLLLFFQLSLLSAATQADPLRVVTEEFPPYNYQLGGDAKGLSSDVVIAALERAGLKVELEFLPWARAYKTALDRPNTLIFSIARIPEREELFNWIGVIAPYRTSLYKLRDNKDIQVERLEDARHLEVGVSLEDVILTYLQGRGFSNLVTTNKDVLNIRKLAGRRIGLIAYDEASFGHAVRMEGYNIQIFERVLRLDELSDHLYMALSRNSDPEMVARLRKALQDLKDDGTFELIQSKHLVLG